MKSRHYSTFLLCIVLSLSTTAYAHPGKTDGKGGHTDHSSGDYHYHHGYDAHQHYDIDGDGDVDCQYNFDDQTGKNSGTGSSGTKNQISYSHSSPTKKQASPSIGKKIVMSLCVLFFVGFLISMPILSFITFLISRIFRGKEISEKAFDILMLPVHIIVCCSLIYLIIIW